MLLHVVLLLPHARFIDDGEETEGDVALEKLVNRMIRALVKTKDQADQEIGETFDKKIRRYFEERGYKFATHTSNTIMASRLCRRSLLVAPAVCVHMCATACVPPAVRLAT